MKSWFAVVSVAVMAGFASSAVADDDHRHNNRQRVFRAELSGYSEVPASLSTPARVQFYAILNKEGTGFTYWLSYSGFTVNVIQSHIHFGQHHTNGGISVWLCESPTNPAPTSVAALVIQCPERATTAPITATITAADVVGPAPQGITGVSAAEFAELLAAMRSGVTYVNVHSTAFPGGEIRGQIK
jgi:hypothetical protein